MGLALLFGLLNGWLLFAAGKPTARPLRSHKACSSPASADMSTFIKSKLTDETLALLTATVEEEISRIFVELPDDIEALESVQQGMATWREVPWSVMTRGMAKEGEQLNTDELHLRAFWVRWAELMEGGDAR